MVFQPISSFGRIEEEDENKKKTQTTDGEERGSPYEN
jgi:hypothetical protein